MMADSGKVSMRAEEHGLAAVPAETLRSSAKGRRREATVLKNVPSRLGVVIESPATADRGWAACRHAGTQDMARGVGRFESLRGDPHAA